MTIFDLKNVIHILFSHLFRMCSQRLCSLVERTRQTSAPPLPFCGRAGEKWKRMAGLGEERTHKLMSQYEQSVVFVIIRFPSTMKLGDLRVRLEKEKSSDHYVRYNSKHECACYVWRLSRSQNCEALVECRVVGLW